MNDKPPQSPSSWFHVVFNDDASRIFLYRKSEIYRAILTRDEVELFIDNGSIVIISNQLDTLVPEILDETRTSYLKAGVQGISQIHYYLAEEKNDKTVKEIEL